MKDMKRVFVVSSLLLVISFTAMAQIFGATQGEEQPAFGATAPSATFQSTSSMPASGSAYSANPTIGEDGAAYTPGAAAAPKAGRSVRREGPVVDENDPGNVPLGDVVWPLMALVGAYVCVRSFKTKRAFAFGK